MRLTTSQKTFGWILCGAIVVAAAGCQSTGKNWLSWGKKSADTGYASNSPLPPPSSSFNPSPTTTPGINGAPPISYPPTSTAQLPGSPYPNAGGQQGSFNGGGFQTGPYSTSPANGFGSANPPNHSPYPPANPSTAQGHPGFNQTTNTATNPNAPWQGYNGGVNTADSRNSSPNGFQGNGGYGANTQWNTNQPAATGNAYQGGSQQPAYGAGSQGGTQGNFGASSYNPGASVDASHQGHNHSHAGPTADSSGQYSGIGANGGGTYSPGSTNRTTQFSNLNTSAPPANNGSGNPSASSYNNSTGGSSDSIYSNGQY